MRGFAPGLPSGRSWFRAARTAIRRDGVDADVELDVLALPHQCDLKRSQIAAVLQFIFIWRERKASALIEKHV